MKARLGTPAALTATAHKLARIVYLNHPARFSCKGKWWKGVQWQWKMGIPAN